MSEEVNLENRTRLEHGQFRVYDQASEHDGHFEVTASELTLLLDGIDLRGAKRGSPASFVGAS